jgi:thioesterase domain-containing protein
MGQTPPAGAPNAQLFNGDGSRRPVLCVMTWADGDHPMRALAERIGADQPMWCLSRDNHDDVGALDVDGWVEWFQELIDREGIEPPFGLAGWSFGGVIALELARRLQSDGREVCWLGLVDTRRPELDHFSLFMARQFVIAFDTLVGFTQRFDYLFFEARSFWGRRLARYRRVTRRRFQRWRGKTTRRAAELETLRARLEPAWESYRTRAYNGFVDLFTTAEYVERCGGDPTLGWGAYLHGGYRINRVPGGHLTIFDEAHLPSLCEIVRSSIDDGAPACERQLERSTRSGPL